MPPFLMIAQYGITNTTFALSFNLPHTVGFTTSYMKLVQKKMAEEREPTISFINYYVILSTFSAYRI
jgi:hypothetical protein